MNDLPGIPRNPPLTYTATAVNGETWTSTLLPSDFFKHDGIDDSQGYTREQAAKLIASWNRAQTNHRNEVVYRLN
jgi:hypothetical protein